MKKTCTECHEPFEHIVVGRGRPPLTCSDRCRMDRANRRDAGRRRASGIKPKHSTNVPCRVSGCDGRAKALGLCAMHHQRQRRGGDAGPPEALPGKCWVVACESGTWCRGLCRLHYDRQMHAGDPGPLRRKKRPAGDGSVGPKGYVRITTPDGRRMDEHRFVMEQVLGRPLLSTETPHHKNGDRADNRIKNLELWSSLQPAGQRVTDKLAYAREIIARYGDLPAEIIT